MFTINRVKYDSKEQITKNEKSNNKLKRTEDGQDLARLGQTFTNDEVEKEHT